MHRDISQTVRGTMQQTLSNSLALAHTFSHALEVARTRSHLLELARTH